MREKLLTRPQISCFGNAFGKPATGFFLTIAVTLQEYILSNIYQTMLPSGMIVPFKIASPRLAPAKFAPLRFARVKFAPLKSAFPRFAHRKSAALNSAKLRLALKRYAPVK